METKEKMETNKHIGQIIRRTFEIVQSVYNNQKEAEGRKSGAPSPLSRIIFPKYRNNKTRFSEQELRFIFVEQLNEEIRYGWDVYYSVETPTINKYLFNVEYPKRDEEDGQSANFDLVIYDSSYNRIALIEFKAKNPADTHDYQKDFVKLTNEGEDGELRYFIQILENTKRDTEGNVKSKIIPKDDENYKEWMNQWGEHKVIVHCISLEKGRGNRAVIDFEEYHKNC